ncbi:hypothetical protein [Hymenobacter metallilatus]|uniref:hypothetical protein n=1 Tax=Hymenobacter metallilatus TaxID=2493666 RepID=UPI001639D515|nr:hypothetical protein [Hymenobacter metallilatus]
MPVSAPLMRRLWRFLLPVVTIGLLAASCRSSQSAYQFRPATDITPRHLVATDSAARLGGVAVEKPMPAQVKRRASGKANHTSRRLVRPLRRAVALVGTKGVVGPGKPAAQAVRRTAGPRQPTEVGLGTTVLGVLGLVVLPVSLLGLLIWGGPVWAILAGLAALAVLVAYLDPFQ